MEMVVDAQIVKGYFIETVQDSDSGLTEKATRLFDRFGSADHVYLDEGGHIEQEWRSVVDPTWFDAWYPQLIMEGAASEIGVGTCEPTLKALGHCGFPIKGNKDIWYIRTAKAVLDSFGRSIIITEDIDFYEPSEKAAGGERRIKILTCCIGKVARHLSKKEKIHVHCIASYINAFCAQPS